MNSYLSLLLFSLSCRVTALELSCEDDIAGILCRFSTEFGAGWKTVTVTSTAGSIDFQSAEIVEIELKNVSSSMPDGLDRHFRAIETLIIHDSELKYIQRANFIGSLTQLEVLSLFGNKIESIPQDAFYDLVDLRHLDVEDNFLVSLHPEMLARSSNLMVFAAGSNKLVEIHKNFFASCPKLWKVFLDGNQIENFEFDVGSARSLSYLSLRGNRGSCDLCFKNSVDRSVLKLKMFQWEIEENCMLDVSGSGNFE